MRMTLVSIVLATFAAIFNPPLLGAEPIELHVAIDGQDANPGTAVEPLATLAGARNRIRYLRFQSSHSVGKVTVFVHEGRYELAECFALSKEDSGTEESPVIYCAAPGETVIISGGRTLNNATLISDHPALTRVPAGVREFVRSYRIDTPDEHALGTIHRRSIGEPTEPAALHIYSEGKSLPTAGWPNHGWATIPDNMSHDGYWHAEVSTFADELTHNVWGHGFWHHDWQDSFESLHAKPHASHPNLSAFKLPTKKPKAGARYRVQNLLSQLDSPGEWYFDTASSCVLVWPLDVDAELHATHLENLVSLYGASYVTLEGMSFDGARSMGVEIAGGDHNTIQNCTVCCIGNVGINVFHGRSHHIQGNTICETGSSAVRIDGGERISLTPADHVCDGNEIYRSGTRYLARRAAVAVFGVGNIIRNNAIHDLPDLAISICGNEHEISGNEIFNVCQLTSDSGAIVLAHDPTFRGNRIVRNDIHDIGGFSSTDVVGIYLDDFASGTLVEGNLLRNVPRGILVGGGRDNTLVHNIVLNSKAAIQVDSRGLSWAKERVEGNQSAYAQYCVAINHDTGIFAETYPQLAEVLTTNPGLASGNVIRSNVIASPIAIDLHDGANSNLVTIEGNQLNGAELLASIDTSDFNAVMFALGLPTRDGFGTSSPAPGRFTGTTQGLPQD